MNTNKSWFIDTWLIKLYKIDAKSNETLRQFSDCIIEKKYCFLYSLNKKY